MKTYKLTSSGLAVVLRDFRKCNPVICDGAVRVSIGQVPESDWGHMSIPVPPWPEGCGEFIEDVRGRRGARFGILDVVKLARHMAAQKKENIVVNAVSYDHDCIVGGGEFGRFMDSLAAEMP